MRQKPEAICTAAMIVINIAVFLILSIFGNTEDGVFMLRHGAMYEPAVAQGHEFYRIFTSMFLHFGISHLLNNMVLLGALGWNLELEVGKVRFVVIYLISGIGGNLLSLYLRAVNRDICRFCRGIGGNIRADGSAALCCDREQREAWKALREGASVYGCAEPVFRADKQWRG